MGCDYIFADGNAEIIIRRARPNENNSVHALVQAIADEIFAFYLRLPKCRLASQTGYPLAWQSQAKSLSA